MSPALLLVGASSSQNFQPSFGTQTEYISFARLNSSELRSRSIIMATSTKPAYFKITRKRELRLLPKILHIFAVILLIIIILALCAVAVLGLITRTSLVAVLLIAVIATSALPVSAVITGCRLIKNLDRFGVLIAYRTLLLVFVLQAFLAFVITVALDIQRRGISYNGRTYIVVGIVVFFLYFAVLLGDFFVLVLPFCWRHDDEDVQNEEIDDPQKEETVLSASV